MTTHRNDAAAVERRLRNEKTYDHISSKTRREAERDPHDSLMENLRRALETRGRGARWEGLSRGESALFPCPARRPVRADFAVS